MSDAVKSGDKDKFTMELMKFNIDVRDVIDTAIFNQNLCFTAVQAPTQEKALSMLTLMVQLGVDLL
jgi:hypothetical protein